MFYYIYPVPASFSFSFVVCSFCKSSLLVFSQYLLFVFLLLRRIFFLVRYLFLFNLLLAGKKSQCKKHLSENVTPPQKMESSNYSLIAGNDKYTYKINVKQIKTRTELHRDNWNYTCPRLNNRVWFIIQLNSFAPNPSQ